ncbi:hypothetical protein MRX96_049605 [Rhipicephalus microplus]
MLLQQQVVAAIRGWLRKAKKSTALAVEHSPTIAHTVAAENTSHDSTRATAPISLTTDDPTSTSLPASMDEGAIDVAEASRKRLRERDEPECPQKQAFTGAASSSPSYSLAILLPRNLFRTARAERVIF